MLATEKWIPQMDLLRKQVTSFVHNCFFCKSWEEASRKHDGVKLHKGYWWGVYNVIPFWLLISSSDQVFSTIEVEVVFRPWSSCSQIIESKRGYLALITGSYDHFSTVTPKRDRHSLSSLLGCSWKGLSPSSLGVLSPKEVEGVSGGCKGRSLFWFQLPCLRHI